MRYVRPQNLREALSLLSSENWSVLSGGTDFYPSLRDQPIRTDVLDIWALRELRSIDDAGPFVRLGALVTWTDIINAQLPAAFDGLKLAAREIGSVQIQNHSTLVGNICNASPAADGVPPLLCLDAQVELSCASSTRQLTLSEFILGNRTTAIRSDELVTAILIPNHSTLGKSTFLKLGSRKYLVISISMVALRLVCDDHRRVEHAAISVGACSATAQRLPELEHALLGNTIDGDMSKFVSAQHLAGLSPIDDVRADKQYRLDASMQLLQRALATLSTQYAR